MTHQPNLNQEGHDIADASLLLLLGTIQKKHIFLTKEDSVLEMKKKVLISKELILYSIIINFKLSSHAGNNSKTLFTLLKKRELFTLI